VRGENTDRASFGGCLALLPPGVFGVRGESIVRGDNNGRSELLPSETKTSDLVPAAATAAGPAVAATPTGARAFGEGREGGSERR
jgi:hypothetical protein